MKYIAGLEKSRQLLQDISSRSKMSGVSKEFAVLDKAEEELIECLMEVRKLKSHFNEIKIDRKNLTNESKDKVISSLIEEIGDIYVDVFIGLPSVIPEITHEAINDRIKYKLNKYKKVIDNLDATIKDYTYTIRRGYTTDEVVDFKRTMSAGDEKASDFNPNVTTSSRAWREEMFRDDTCILDIGVDALEKYIENLKRTFNIKKQTIIKEVI